MTCLLVLTYISDFMHIGKYLACLFAVRGSTRPLLDPDRFPEAGTSVLPIGPFMFKLVRYLDMGSSTRVYLARKIAGETTIPEHQTYSPPPESGQTLDVEIPDEIVVKCLSSSSEKLLFSIENEFRVFAKLNEHTNVKKPIGIYLSPRWKCKKETELCQYIAMTYVNSDVDRLVSRGELKLKPPVLFDQELPQSPGIYSFEIFVLSMGLSLIDALDKFHHAGFAHGDVRTCNIALQAPRNDQIVLLDVGASKILSEFSVEERDKLIERDFYQVITLMQKLISRRIISAYHRPGKSGLVNRLEQLTWTGKVELSRNLEGILAAKYGVHFDIPHIVYKYIP